MNLAYKHLDTKLRIGELTIGQWVGVILGIALGFAWGVYLSPLGTYLTLISAIYIGGIPVGATLLATVSDFDLWLLIRSAVSWRRTEGRFMPGPGTSARGYAVAPDPQELHAESARQRVEDLDLASLWEDT